MHQKPIKNFYFLKLFDITILCSDANLNIKDNDDKAALMRAKIYRHTELIRLLKEARTKE